MNSDRFYIVLPAAKLAVAAGGGTMIDLFNGTTDRLLRVRSARVFADCIAAITGVPILFRLQRTTDVGTGGTAITPLAFDLGLQPLQATVSCRSLPTGGATTGATLGTINGNPDEAAESALEAAWSGTLGELLPEPIRHGPGLVVRPGAGCAIVAEGSSLVANVWCVVVFSSEPLRLNS
jgi:hypothetical protein